MKIIIDCDNTFGVAGCDIDDGLAILYALGTRRADILGITTTFGNNTLEVTHPTTVSFMEKIGHGHVPVIRGHESAHEENAAAKFLVEAANQHLGDLSILAIGSLTNLYHAWLLDNTFFEKLDKLSMMGGVTQPLIIAGKQLGELNFSCSATAAFNVLTHAKSLIIATGNNCLAALSTTARFNQLAQSQSPFLRWLQQTGSYWFEREYGEYGIEGIYKWDVYAAAALLHPEFFEENVTTLTFDEETIKRGMLIGSGAKKCANLPTVKDSSVFEEHIYQIYAQFAQL
ncbi:MAG: nucleoside hydrolase [Defluviitaleaceae bacterium]|nr:nucleoside hydrolase [Defluviitaleaceae bacterium]